MTISTELSENSKELVLDRMDIFWIKIHMNIELKHWGSFFLFADVQFFSQQLKFWEW